MTIRAIIKTSHLVQLALLLVLVVCFGLLGRELWQVNGTLARQLEADFLVDELERNAGIKFRHALDYAASMAKQPVATRLGGAGEIAEGQPARQSAALIAELNAPLKALQELWLVENGLKPWPQTALFHAGEHISLARLLSSMPICDLEVKLMEHLLERNSELNRQLKWAVMLAGGLGSDDDTNFIRIGLPQPEEAQNFLVSDALLAIPSDIARLTKELRQHFAEYCLGRLEHENQIVLWVFAGCGLVVLCLLSSLAVISWFSWKRITLPIGIVGAYAEAVASGGEPAPLTMKYGDEIASMYGSLLKLQGTLSLRVRELKASEQASQASSQQAMLSKAQALSSLNMAQKALATQEKFLAQVSREVRQPIHEILSTSWQALQAEPNRKLHGWLLRINQSGGALLDIFNRILDVSGFEEDGMRREEENIALIPFLELLRQSVAAVASEKGLSLTLQAASDLPVEIAGDKRHIEETLRILLGNAVRHTNAGHVRLKVLRLADSREGRARLRFSVSDSGPGFSPEEQDRIFAIHNMPAGDSGTSLGMGIALARHLVQFMGGELQLESSPRGSVFSFELDCAVVAESGEPARQPLALVVDDSEINLEIVCEALEQLGVETLRAEDGQQALDAVANRRPDIILMDVQMPVLDGLAATRALREQGHSRIALPVIAMTGDGDEEARESCIRAGMNGHLEKPLDVQALMRQLAQWLPGGLPEAVRERSEHGDSEASVAEAAAAEGAGTRQTRQLQSGSAKSSDAQYIESRRGLAAVGGNVELYNELLQRFADSYGNSMAEIQAAFGRNDLAAMSRLVHTVKGVSANLGLARLTELCRRMEEHLPQTPPTPEELKAFAAVMQGTLLQISERQVQHGQTAPVVARVLAKEHQQGLLRLLHDLPQRLQRDWGGLESALEAFMPLVQGTPLAAEMQALLAAVNSFDITDATEHTALLRRKLSGARHEDGILH